MKKRTTFNRERMKRITRRLQATLREMQRSALRWTLIIILVALTCILGVVLFSPIVQVREITVTRLSARLDIEEVQRTLAPMFGRHLFFLSSYEITALLEDNIRDVYDIQVSKTYPSTLNVSIQLDPLVARLLIQSPDAPEEDIGTGATLDYVTEDGVYVHTAAPEAGSPLPLIILVDWGARPQPGEVLLTPDFLKRIDAAEIALLHQFGKETQRRIVYLRAQEYHMVIDGAELWFDLRSPLEEQLQRYRTFLKSVEAATVREYIDLRLADRVVYR